MRGFLGDRSDILEGEAQRFRASGLLGRSTPLIALFDYLLVASLEGRAPKEDEIAFAVFNREPGFDRGQDSVVRVYAHRLRRSLEAAYAEPGLDGVRLELPRGEYRLQVAAPEPETSAPEESVARPRWWKQPVSMRMLAPIVLLVGVASAAGSWAVLSHGGQDGEVAAGRANSLWSPLLANDLPTLVVVGDYFLIGESDDGVEVNRLVREFDVNGSADLERHFLSHPDSMAHYMDMDLRYLPTSSALALGRVMPVLGRMGGTRGTSVILASDLTPAMLKSSNIVYVGLISGMGLLRQSAFAASRFAVGSDFDEIVDTRGGHRYISQAAMPQEGNAYSDYGLLSTFQGPEGNMIVIMAGTRDTAVQEMSEMATRSDAVEQARKGAGGKPAFEALYEVAGMDKTNVTGKLLIASAIDSVQVWSAQRPSH
ncbi:MAG TPA: hypothetical protein VF475_10010 [Sphingobium sp.]